MPKIDKLFIQKQLIFFYMGGGVTLKIFWRDKLNVN